MLIKPDGKVHIHQGVGNLGTHSVFDTARVVPEILGCKWEDCEVTWGDTSKGVAWSSSQAGSQTAHAHSRANHAAAMDGIAKLQELAALEKGGKPDSYKVAGGRVSGPGGSLTFAQAAEAAIKRGGKFDGHELPENINAMTKASATGLAGQGLMGVARDSYPRTGATYSFVVGFAEVEVDVETGNYQHPGLPRGCGRGHGAPSARAGRTAPRRRGAGVLTRAQSAPRVRHPLRERARDAHV